MIRIILLLASICACRAFAESPCSLLVKVETPYFPEANGLPGRTPDREVAVAVEELDGWRHEFVTLGGVVRVCGLGYRPVPVTVGRHVCHQVVVRNVLVELERTRTIRVLYDADACDQEEGPPPPPLVCAILWRFVDGRHRPAGVGEVIGQLDGRETKSRTDDYGRVKQGRGLRVLPFLRVSGKHMSNSGAIPQGGSGL